MKSISIRNHFDVFLEAELRPRKQLQKLNKRMLHVNDAHKSEAFLLGGK
jgi:hypothetical protein